MVGKKILIVDENTASRSFLAKLLCARSNSTFWRHLLAKKALIVAWRDEPDLILFDPVLIGYKDEEFITNCAAIHAPIQRLLIALSSDPSPAAGRPA